MYKNAPFCQFRDQLTERCKLLVDRKNFPSSKTINLKYTENISLPRSEADCKSLRHLVIEARIDDRIGIISS